MIIKPSLKNLTQCYNSDKTNYKSLDNEIRSLGQLFLGKNKTL